MLRYLGKVDILGHPKDVDVHGKLMNLVRPKEQRCCLVHLPMFALQKGTVKADLDGTTRVVGMTRAGCMRWL